MQPSISIVMPVRNEAQYIEQNLRQILDQDYPLERMEIIVADGMSDDGTREVLQRFADEFEQISMIDNERFIVPTGINEAIRQSTGEIVIRVDGHVVVNKDFVSQSVKALQDHPDAWAAGGPIVHYASTPTGKAISEAMSHRIGVGNATHRLPEFEGYGEGTAFPAMYRWVFDRVGYYDETLVRNQDDEYYFRLAQAGGKFFITPRIKYRYFVRETLAQLYRQYYQYSFWRIPVIRKHRQPTTVRQMIPSLFYLAMIVMLVVGLFLRSPALALALPLTYVLVLSLVGLSKIASRGPKIAVMVPLAIATMHAGYALGMIHGTICHLFGIDAWQQSNKRVVQLSR